MNSICHIVRINESPAPVFRALTDNHTIEQWFTQTSCKAWQKGGRVIWFGSTVMTISEMNANRSITFNVEKGSGWEGTVIRFELEPQKDSTIVRFDQTGWREVTDHFRDCSMSWAYFLESLRLYLETGVGTPEEIG